MSSEMEALGLASLGAVSQHQAADLKDQACRNCGAEIETRYCTVCGQLAASFHRPVWTLVGEAVADTFALDGRLARTLPLLFFRPGRLTRNYTAGQRARYVPPFRLFLLASVLFYFTLFALVGNAGWIDDLKINLNNQDLPALAEAGLDETAERGLLRADGTLDRDLVLDALSDRQDIEPDAGRVLNEAFDIVDNPQGFLDSLQRWAPRFSLLLLPVTILSLSLLNFWRRSVYIYDHTIHALHLQTWLYLSVTALMLTGQFVAPGTMAGIVFLFVIYFIFYIIRSLSVSTKSSILFSIIRSFFIIQIWFVSFAIISFLLIIVGALEA